jgi:hypothetical protein
MKRHLVAYPVKSAMEFVLGFQPWLETEYKDNSHVNDRVKFTDYTSRGLSVMNTTFVLNKIDLRLSELRKDVYKLPQGQDVGCLTTLVQLQLEVPGFPDLAMSQVETYVAKSGVETISHGAVEDGACCVRWSGESSLVKAYN